MGSVARASLLLGSKLEEHAVPLARLLDAFHLTDVAYDAALRAAVQAGRAPRHLTPATPEFWAAKRATVRAESVVLTQLGFMVDVATPHRRSSRTRACSASPAPLVGRALAVCNDALRTDLCARCAAPELAAAALLVAARLARCPLPGPECPDGPVAPPRRRRRPPPQHRCRDCRHVRLGKTLKHRRPSKSLLPKWTRTMMTTMRTMKMMKVKMNE